jgi:hypothetical protein
MVKEEAAHRVRRRRHEKVGANSSPGAIIVAIDQYAEAATGNAISFEQAAPARGALPCRDCQRR